LGIGWGCWHVPYYLGAWPQGEKTPLFLAWFLLGTLPITILFTWIHNRAGGSLLLMVLFHSALDGTLGFFFNPLPVGELRPFIFVGGFFAITALIVLRRTGVQLGRQDQV